MNEKIVELEKQVAFQEHTIADLNAELIEHQKRITVLEKQVRSLVEHSRSGGALVRDLKDEVPPPHY
ncbi:MAG: SlyX family protein [Candidatus Omnitrophica bacterium]|nr:SlyX family protein [Candidatus Omnitrophota bacterium]